MFDFLKKKKEVEACPIAPVQEEPQSVVITDPELYEQKKQELLALIDKATADGYVSPLEYKELHQLIPLLDISKDELAEMIREEFKKEFRKKVQVFADDGKVDEKEMRILAARAHEIGITAEQMQIMIDEAIAQHKEEVRKKIREVGKSILNIGKATASLFTDGNTDNKEASKIMLSSIMSELPVTKK